MDRGKLTKFVDFRGIAVPDALLQLKVSPEVLDKDVADLGNRFATIEATSDGISPGDIVVIQVETPVDADPNGADYRHEAQASSGSIQINVGKGFYDKDFEQSLLGKKTGDDVVLPKRGQGKPGTISEIKRIIPAEVTDDLAKKAGFNDLNAYREHKREEHENKDKRKKLDGIVSFLTKALREQCEFGDIEPEIAEAIEEGKAQFQMFAEKDGMTLEEMEAKIIPGGKEEKESFYRGKAEENVKNRLISRATAERDGVEFNRESYEAMVAEYVAKGMDEEKLRQQMPYEDYLKFAGDNYIVQCIQKYFADKFKAVIL
ncbi:MAG: hypothetical protein LUE20_01410 [Oscillospiraceae bacterium]|nr:hypothetical protein [Oscillospiraceae bacterium]